WRTSSLARQDFMATRRAIEMSGSRRRRASSSSSWLPIFSASWTSADRPLLHRASSAAAVQVDGGRRRQLHRQIRQEIARALLVEPAQLAELDRVDLALARLDAGDQRLDQAEAFCDVHLAQAGL